MTASEREHRGPGPAGHLRLSCGRMRDRERVCCGPRRDIAICLDCAEPAVDVIRTGLPSPA